MIVFSGTFVGTDLAEILRMLVKARQTGNLTVQESGQEGTLAVENGMIVNAKTGLSSGMHALFELVGWHEARFEFREEPLAPDFPRDLSVYDPEVLIAGVAAKAKSAAMV
jgi:hypothetical protein